MQKVHIPFDGFGKTTNEAAEIISQQLKRGRVETVQFIVPAQWSWNLNNLIHPDGGLVSILRRDESVVRKYDLTCFASREGMGITAYPC